MFVSPFLHKAFRAGGWVAEDKAEEERLRKRDRQKDAESRPRAQG